MTENDKFFITTRDYWDCECETDYIHPRRKKRCKKCRAYWFNCPESRISEVEAHLEAKKQEKIEKERTRKKYNDYQLEEMMKKAFQAGQKSIDKYRFEEHTSFEEWLNKWFKEGKDF
jgi:hypothetical protein